MQGKGTPLVWSFGREGKDEAVPVLTAMALGAMVISAATTLLVSPTSKFLDLWEAPLSKCVGLG